MCDLPVPMVTKGRWSSRSCHVIAPALPCFAAVLPRSVAGQRARRTTLEGGGRRTTGLSIWPLPVRVGGERETPAREHQMKNYLLSVYQPEGTPPPPDVLEKIMQEVGTLRDEMKAAGAWVFSGGLNAPSTATVLRFNGGDVLITDGPFAEGKEYLGGFTIVKAPDLDAALEWGRRLARVVTLPIEVRPFVDEAGD